MKRIITLVIVSICFASLLLTGCIPTIIGAAVYKSSKTRASKERFMSQFNQTNIERKKAGLPPLDLCTEQYHFDKKWADNDPICDERIIRYEMGDESALGHPKLEVVDSEDVESTEPEIQRTSDKQPTAP